MDKTSFIILGFRRCKKVRLIYSGDKNRNQNECSANGLYDDMITENYVSTQVSEAIRTNNVALFIKVFDDYQVPVHYRFCSESEDSNVSGEYIWDSKGILTLLKNVQVKKLKLINLYNF